MSAPPFKGIPVVLAGVTHIMPRLSFGGFEDAKDTLKRIAEGDFQNSIELQDAFIEVLMKAFQRNYPAMEAKLLKGELDWDSAPALFEQLLALSVPSAPLGEPVVGSQSGPSTGKRRSRK